MTDVLITLQRVDQISEAELTTLVRHGLTGVRIVVKGRPIGDIVGDVERLLRLSDCGFLTGPIWVDFPGFRPRVAAVDARLGVLEPNAEVTVSEVGGAGHIRLEYGHLILPRARPGAELLFADGVIRLVVVDVVAGEPLRCEVVAGGTIKLARSVSLKDHVPADYFGISDLDVAVVGLIGYPTRLRYVASWVASAADVVASSEFVRMNRLIPKLESPIASDELGRIMSMSATPILIGRADLVAHVGADALGHVVDTYVSAAGEHGREVFVGSLLLDSLESSERADRSDLADVEHLRELGVSGFLVSGGGDPDARRRKVGMIASMVQTEGT